MRMHARIYKETNKYKRTRIHEEICLYNYVYVYIYIFHSFPRVEISSRSTYKSPRKSFPTRNALPKRREAAERCGSTNCVSFKPNHNNNNNTKKLRVLLTLPWMNPLFIKTTPGFPASSSSSSFLSSQKAENFSAGRVSAALAPVALAQQRRR